LREQRLKVPADEHSELGENALRMSDVSPLGAAFAIQAGPLLSDAGFCG